MFSLRFFSFRLSCWLWDEKANDWNTIGELKKDRSKFILPSSMSVVFRLLDCVFKQQQQQQQKESVVQFFQRQIVTIIGIVVRLCFVSRQLARRTTNRFHKQPRTAERSQVGLFVSDAVCLSARLSVCPFVCSTRALINQNPFSSFGSRSRSSSNGNRIYIL